MSSSRQTRRFRLVPSSNHSLNAGRWRVERTAPFAFIAYTLVIVWYVLHGQRSAAAKLPTMPWYAHKLGVNFQRYARDAAPRFLASETS